MRMLADFPALVKQYFPRLLNAAQNPCITALPTREPRPTAGVVPHQQLHFPRNDKEKSCSSSPSLLPCIP